MNKAKKGMSMSFKYQKVKQFRHCVQFMRCSEKMLKSGESFMNMLIKKDFKKRHLKKITKKEFFYNKLYIINII